MKTCFGDITILETITKRDSSEIYHVEFNGDNVCLKILSPDCRFSMEFYKKSYQNYTSMCNNKDFVKTFWVREHEGKLYIFMEYLDGYKRLEYTDCKSDMYHMEMMRIHNVLYKQGLIMLDFAPINFMTNGSRVKMVDLDTIVKISDLPEGPFEPSMAWSWYGSRMGKYFTWRNRGE